MKLKIFLGFEGKFNQISYTLVRIWQIIDTKQMKKKKIKRLPFVSKNIDSNECLVILCDYLMPMTFYYNSLYVNMNIKIFQHVKILARK
jgi:hypothetical protein